VGAFSQKLDIVEHQPHETCLVLPRTEHLFNACAALDAKR